MVFHRQFSKENSATRTDIERLGFARLLKNVINKITFEDFLTLEYKPILYHRQSMIKQTDPP